MTSSTEPSEAYQIHLLDISKDHLSPTLLNNLVLTTVPKPVPGPNSFLVRIRAAALNYRDLLVLASSPKYPAPPVEGLIPLCDGAGEIVEVGVNSKWKVGDNVLLLPNHDWMDGDVYGTRIENTLGCADVDGTLAQYTVVQDEFAVRMPKNLSFEEAACLPGCGGTATNVLQSIDIKKGTTVVTQGTGGVSCFVIQFAAAKGARVIATSSTTEKLKIAKQLGASDLINYKTTPDWSAEVLRLTNGKGADLVADVGGSGTVVQSLAATRQGGTTCLIGFLTPPENNDLVMPLIVKAITLKGILNYSRVMLENAVKLVEEHDLHPPISQVFEWKDAHKAYEKLRDQEFTGKIVIKV